MLLLIVVLGGGIVWVRSPVALLALPTLAWRWASHEPAYLSSTLHYDAVMVPVVGAALIDALSRLGGEGPVSAQRSRRRTLRGPSPGQVGRRVRGTGAMRDVAAWAAAGCCVLVTSALLPPSALLASATTWRPGSRVQDLRDATAIIPTRTTVAADNFSGAYLIGPAGGNHDVRGWSSHQSLSTLPRWIVLTADRPSMGTSMPQLQTWLAHVRSFPGVTMTQEGGTTVIHLPDTP